MPIIRHRNLVTLASAALAMLAAAAAPEARCTGFQPAQPHGQDAHATTRPQAAKSQPAEDADTQEYKNYRLNMDNVRKYVEASKALVKLTHDDPALEKEMESQSDATTIDATVKATEKYPLVTAAIKNAGLSTRDFVVITGTLTGTEMAVGMKKQGQMKSYPPSISPENAAFVEQNWDKINAMMKSVADAAGNGKP